jgi:hypothetical protein
VGTDERRSNDANDELGRLAYWRDEKCVDCGCTPAEARLNIEAVVQHLCKLRCVDSKACERRVRARLRKGRKKQAHNLVYKGELAGIVAAMKIGFTGTRTGMNSKQRADVSALLKGLVPFEAHHGCCVGADADFHRLVVDLGCDVVGHPPTNTSSMMSDRLIYEGARANQYRELPAKPYLDRNHDIVDACDLLIATPATRVEKLRSGTWATIRYARRCGKKLAIIFPS